MFQAQHKHVEWRSTCRRGSACAVPMAPRVCRADGTARVPCRGHRGWEWRVRHFVYRRCLAMSVVFNKINILYLYTVEPA